MSIYFSASAIVIGRPSDVMQIDRILSEAQAQCPSETFDREVVFDGDVLAIAYRAGNTNYRSQLQEVLSQKDLEIDALDVCVFLLRETEMENVTTLCYQLGRDLAHSDDPYDNTAIDLFRHRCIAYGVDLKRADTLSKAIAGHFVEISPPALTAA